MEKSDQVKLDFKEKYENDIIAFVEDFYKVELYPWQKLMLKMMDQKEKLKDGLITFYTPYRHGRDILFKARLEWMKLMEMSFDLWTKESIEVYEKGVLVKIIKHKNKKEGIVR